MEYVARTVSYGMRSGDRAPQALITQQEQQKHATADRGGNGTLNDALCSVSSAKEQTWQVFLKTLDDPTLVLDVTQSTTVCDFKVLVEEKTDVSIDEQRLIYAGKEMKQLEFRLWDDYQVPPQGTIHLALRLRGGL